MESKPTSTSNDLRKNLDLFFSHWKIIVLCGIIGVVFGYIYLRYSTYQYSASATIKIRDDKQSQKLPGSIEEMQSDYSSANNIIDEVAVIKSHALIENVVKTLGLNIRSFEQGSIKEKELYKNPPIKLSFFENDTIINKVDTTLYIKVKSPTKFLMFKDDGKSLLRREDSEGKMFSFGDRIKTGFGDMVLIPNVGSFAPRVGSNLKISITPVRRIVNKYHQKVVVSTSEGSSVIRLELQESIAQKAIDFLNQLIKEYNQDVLSDKEAIVNVTSEFIDNRLEKVAEDLEQVDFTAEQLQKKNRLTALNSQADIYLKSERQTEAEIVNTTNKIQLISFLEKEITDENKSSSMLPADIGIGDPNISQITKNHNDLVAQRDKLLRNSSEKNPIVVNLNNQINALKSNLQNSLKNMRETTQLTLNSLNQEDARIRGQLYSAPTRQRQFRDIKRQQDIKESLYLYLLEKREESAIRYGMYSPSAKIIDNAHSSFNPVAPKRNFVYLASLLLGLAVPIGIIYLSNLLDTKIYDKEDLMSILNIPYIGDVPRTSRKKFLIKKFDYSSKAEAFRIIRSNIDFMLKNTEHRSKKVFITSTRAQEGKSHTSTNLASSISFSEKSVLLIEMDIRVPKIMDYLGLKPSSEMGLTDYIVDKSLKPSDIVNKYADNEYLDIIHSGSVPPNPSELLMSDRIGELFAYFENKYDYIIADTSAVGIVSDTLLISKFADMFIYVVSANSIDRRELIGVSKKLYEDNRLPNMTMLLNGTVIGKKGYGYGYGYGNNPNRKRKWYQKKLKVKA